MRETRPAGSDLAWVGAFILVAACAPVSLQLTPGRSTVLSAAQAEEATHPCSRQRPPEFEATWQPMPEDIQRLESELGKLEGTKSKLCCGPGFRLRNVDRYYRQYVGIVVNGRHLIYINAFTHERPPDRWRDEAVIFCDGGTDVWGALWDPETGRFSELAFNGSA